MDGAFEVDDGFSWLQAWRAGDASAGVAVRVRATPMLTRFFLNKIDGHADLLVEQTFAAVRVSEDVLGEDTLLESFFYRVARRQLVAYWNLRARVATWFSFQTSIVELGAVSNSPCPSSDRQQQTVLMALRHLPLDYQIVLEFHYFEGLDVSTMCRVMDLSRDRVAQRLVDAKKNLARLLGASATEHWVEHAARACTQSLPAAIERVGA